MFGSPGKEEGCLWFPRKVVVMKNTTGNFVVCDRGCERSRMQIFSPQVLNIIIFIREKVLIYFGLISMIQQFSKLNFTL